MSLPLRARLTAWYMALLATVLAALSTFLILRLHANLVASLDRTLDARVAEIALGFRGKGEGEFRDITQASLTGLPRGESAAQLLAPDGRVLESVGDPVARRPVIDVEALGLVTRGERLRVTVELGPDRERFRALATRLPSRTSVVVVLSSTEEVDRSVHGLLVLVLVGGPAALAAAAVGGWLLAGRALLPVARMTRKAAGIGAEHAHERVEVPAHADELQRLAVTLNAMLDRLQAGIDDQRRFVADASHELRTPLGVMRTELEVSLRAGNLSPEAREALESTKEEVERMARIVDDLLTLARLDAADRPSPGARADLLELATRVVDGRRRAASDAGVELEVGGSPAVARGDAGRLEQVLSNLVDNALKYAQPGGRVGVEVRLDDGEAGFTVTDDGIGIPAESLPHVFDRFFRVDPARTRAEGGSGLGLAICKAIVESHGGRISVQSRVGRGTSVRVVLPAGSLDRDEGATAAPAPARAD
jgi:heavy metal sensor kinase